MGIQVVQYDANMVRFGIGLLNQPFHAMREILAGPPMGDGDMTFSDQWLQKHEQITGAIASILIIIALNLPGMCGQGATRFLDQLLARLVKANHRPFWIVGLGIQVQYILHAGHERRSHSRNTPLLLLPRLQLAFFKAWRTVS